jgi:transcriptional regulator with XRE-family HTH domain
MTTNESQRSTQTFRKFLQDELLRRVDRNPGYSLRAFARSLGINPASLSRILRGQRIISEDMREKLAQRLGLHPTEYQQLDLNDSSEPGAQAQYHQLSLDAFQVISDWYHYAILELVNTRGFKPDARWVATRLGITTSEVHAAVERLTRLGMLEVTEEGQWINASGSNTNIAADMRAAAYRKLQRQSLEMAIRALDEVPIEKRDQSTMTMSVDSRKLPEAAERITRFRRELCEFLEQGNTRDHVYQLVVSLYPLTQLKPIEEEGE